MSLHLLASEWVQTLRVALDAMHTNVAACYEEVVCQNCTTVVVVLSVLTLCYDGI